MSVNAYTFGQSEEDHKYVTGSSTNVDVCEPPKGRTNEAIDSIISKTPPITEEQFVHLFYKLPLTKKMSMIETLVRIASDEIGAVERSLANKTAKINLASKLANNGKANKTIVEGIRNILSDDE